MGEMARSERRVQLQQLLRKIRADAKLRQADLAVMLGQPQSFVSKYESGERRLDILELEEVCKCCGVTLTSFVERLGRISEAYDESP